ncbi:MAG: iron-containing alcohol dehydrogenase, partial [Actinomycetota bacterium]
MGGGSALDIAKCAVALPTSPEAALAAVSGSPLLTHRRSRLILVPTTAGTGSEVTCFATVYHGLRKLSL